MMSKPPALMIRRFVESDVPAALTIQAASFPAFLLEDEPAFASRVRLASSCCFVAMQGATMAGYVLAHGWPTGSPPPVGAVLADSPRTDVLFIHDLAVSPSARGLSAGRELVEAAFMCAARQGLRQAELIAVEGAATYWRAMGFSEVEISGTLAEKVAGYGADARWMTSAIPAH